MQAALRDIVLEGETIAIVTHDAVLQLTLAAILGLPIGSYRGLCQATATLNEVHLAGGKWSVAKLNSHWHLADVAAVPGANHHLA